MSRSTGAAARAALLAALLLACPGLSAKGPAASPAAAPAPATPSPSAAGEAASPTPQPGPSGGAAPAAMAAPTPSPGDADLVQKTLPLDLQTADYYGLLDWCRSLGISDAGTAEDLRSRLYGYYQIPPPAAKGQAARSIEILSADKTEYFTIDSDGEDYVRLTGRVELKMVDKEKNWTHDIVAREIVYNKTLHLLSAEGEVKYVLQRSGSTEVFQGDRLVVDLDDWTGDFIDGTIYRSGGSSSAGSTSGTVFSFKADGIRKGEGDLVVLDNATISSCDDEHPHWSIRASKAWLLGKSEWALAFPVLSVGEVPVLWLPGFWYSGEEIVFHPVFGSRDREGTFVQTTTYLLGKKPAAKESISLLKLAQDDQSTKKELKGFYLMSTDQAAPASDSQNTLKAIFDIYSNLGAFAALDGSFSYGPLKNLTASVVLGATRNLYLTSSNTYTPFSADDGYQSVWNGSYLFGLHLPLRYSLDLGATFQAAAFSLALLLPAVSDPYIDQDYKDRSEDMNWLGFLEGTKTTNTTSVRSTLTSSATASWSPSTGVLSPWLSSFSLSNLTAGLAWSSKAAVTDSGTAYDPVDPQRLFYYPDLLTVFNGKASLGGTILSLPFKASPQRPTPGKGAATGSNAAPTPDGLPLPDARGPSDEARSAAPPAEPSPSPSSGEGPDFRMPEAATGSTASASAASPSTDSSFSLGWDLAPSGSYQRRYLSQPWANASQIDLNEVLNDTAVLSLSGHLTESASLMGGIVSSSGSLTASSQVQDHPYAPVDPLYQTQTALGQLQLADWKFRSDSLTGTLNLSASPFKGMGLFSGSSLSYALTGLLYRNAYDSTGDDGDPVYKQTFPQWDKDSITTHSVSATFQAQPLSWTESLSLGADLAPRPAAFTGKLALQAWTLSATAGTRLAWNDASSDWAWDPLAATASLTPLQGFSLSDSFSWNIQDWHAASNILSLSLWDLSASYGMTWAQPNRLIAGTGWVGSGDYAFLPASLTASWRPSLPATKLWKDRISLQGSANASLNLNLLRFTESAFNFTLSGTASLSDFMDINISTASQNSAVYLYLVGLLPGFEVEGADVERRNPLVDLAKSFNFFQTDQADRKESKFKLTSISASAVHHLHDWDFNAFVTGTPTIVTKDSKRVFQMNTTISVSLSWKDIPEIKSSVSSTINGDTTTLTVQ